MGEDVLVSGESLDTKTPNLRASLLASVETTYITYDAMQNGKQRTFASTYCDCEELFNGHSFYTLVAPSMNQDPPLNVQSMSRPQGLKPTGL